MRETQIWGPKKDFKPYFETLMENMLNGNHALRVLLNVFKYIQKYLQVHWNVFASQNIFTLRWQLHAFVIFVFE